MKIAFNRLPFTVSQKEELNAIAAAHGCEALWFANGEKPQAAGLLDCDALMGYFSPKLLKSLPRLRWVQLPCAGAEKYCGNVYASEETVLTNSSGAFGVAIAEYMICTLLMLMRRMPAYMKGQQARQWQFMDSSRSIYGSVITVVGMGDIGTHFARRAKAMGAHVRGVRRSAREAPACFDEVFTSDHVLEALRGADAVVMCLPSTPDTQKFISEECIAAMGPETLLVNCGRGATLDEQALIRALQEGKLGGCALDVTAVEPLPEDSPLWNMENVIITPHISGRDSDPVNSPFIFEICRDNLRRFLSGQPLTHIVDRTRGY